MKRYLIILILLFALPVQAQELARLGPTMMGGGLAGASSDSCTGGLLFSWHAETTDVTTGGVSGGVNNGCSAGDTTATANNNVELSTTQKSDGAKSIKITAATDHYSFGVSSSDIVSKAAGRFTGWIYMPNKNMRDILRVNFVEDVTNRYINVISYPTTSYLYISYTGSAHTTCQTTEQMPTDEWVFVWASWSVAGVGGKTLRVGFSSDGTTPTNFVECTGALNDPGTPAYVRFGDSDRNGYGHYIDNVKIYNAW